MMKDTTETNVSMNEGWQNKFMDKYNRELLQMRKHVNTDVYIMFRKVECNDRRVIALLNVYEVLTRYIVTNLDGLRAFGRKYLQYVKFLHSKTIYSNKISSWI